MVGNQSLKYIVDPTFNPFDPAPALSTVWGTVTPCTCWVLIAARKAGGAEPPKSGDLRDVRACGTDMKRQLVTPGSSVH